MSSVNLAYPEHVFSLLGQALNTAKNLMEAAEDAQPHHLRGSHMRVLSLTPREGIRQTDLAVRVRMTKQSIGEFIAALQKAGYLEVIVDPADKRARLVSPTPHGIEVQDRILQAFAEVEARWREQVGPRRWATFRSVLTELAAQGGQPDHSTSR